MTLEVYLRETLTGRHIHEARLQRQKGEMTKLCREMNKLWSIHSYNATQ